MAGRVGLHGSLEAELTMRTKLIVDRLGASGGPKSKVRLCYDRVVFPDKAVAWRVRIKYYVPKITGGRSLEEKLVWFLELNDATVAWSKLVRRAPFFLDELMGEDQYEHE